LPVNQGRMRGLMTRWIVISMIYARTSRQQ
jgi:hypothetical protein